MIARLAMLSLALAVCVEARAHAQTQWTLPSAYPANNFHAENLSQFAKDVKSLAEQLVARLAGGSRR